MIKEIFENMIAVKIDNGLVVWHTREEYARLIKDVDMYAARKAVEELNG